MATLTAEKTVNCRHNEIIKGDQGICSTCGQVRQYDRYSKEPPTIVKRGRIGGVLTNVVPNNNNSQVTPRPLPKPTPTTSIKEEQTQPHQEESPEPASEEQTSAPPEPRPAFDDLSKKQKGEYFNQHKEEILKDIKELGETAARKKWNILSPTFTGLKRRWKLSIAPKQKHSSKLKQQKKNKEAIIADYYSMPIQDFLKKWRLSSASWRKLREEWKVVSKRQVLPEETPLPEEKEELASPHESPNLVTLRLPALPEFDPNWSFSVQIQWLETYEAIITKAMELGLHQGGIKK